MSKYYFCTLFDKNYVYKGLAMIISLQRNCPNAHIFVLCMDKKTRQIIDKFNLEFVQCINLEEIETDDLLQAKMSRGPAEYCWTLSSNFTWFVMREFKYVDLITYVDADLYFYSDVQPLFDEIQEASITIIEHRFSERLKDREVNGRFCVEWNSFKRNEEGLACPKKWSEQCLDWCYYRLEDGKMGDQKYLDTWPLTYSSCHILQNVGAGVAPWNYVQYNFSKNEDDEIFVDDTKLIFYHFHQFQILGKTKFDRVSSFYTSESPEPNDVYKFYEQQLKEIIETVQIIEPSFQDGFKSTHSTFTRRLAQKFFPMWFKNLARNFIRY